MAHTNGAVYGANQSMKIGAITAISALNAIEVIPNGYAPPSEVGIVSPGYNHAHPEKVAHKHLHVHDHSSHETKSRFTRTLLPFAKGYPLLYTILAEKDSRRIAYFMTLNFAFMIVQAFYGFVTDSLGLLSDSIHMFFDCLALGVGLFAAVASKWPPSERFPYGFGKIESLSGFGNGVFLILISIEIMVEASERIVDGRETRRLNELLVVSTLGLIVNLVGMACFGHHHHGHDHGSCPSHSHSHVSPTPAALHSEKGHSCDHSQDHNSHHSHNHHHHDHSHSHDQSHNHHHHSQDHHDHGHTHKHKRSPSTSPKLNDPMKPVSHHHSHSHDNENMRGIFLHILADTMGSGAVIVSTLLIRYAGWSGWDPIASCIIAILIFLSSIPLVTSSARKLLLTVPDDIEYSLRDTLGEVANLRGVESICVPRFWLGDGGLGVDRGEGARDGKSESVMGVMHICATRGSEFDDVRNRATRLLSDKALDVVVQVEPYGDTSCFCHARF